MVYRVYVEKKPGFDLESRALLSEIKQLLLINSVTGLRLINRYDVEGIDEALFSSCVRTVFSEPQTDNAFFECPEGETVFAVEYLPGQFDQRAESAAECIQLISQGERPTVRSAKIYVLSGNISENELAEIKKYVINPVEAREAGLEARETLSLRYPEPPPVPVLDGFISLDSDGLSAVIRDYGLAMDLADITFFQSYFKNEDRDPTLTELRVVDTYWSDHCRHTTFGTILDDVSIDDPDVQRAWDRYTSIRDELYAGRSDKPVCLMDMAVIGAKWLKKTGRLTDLDESEEINACTVKIKADIDGEKQDWLLLFKNETHNHPTEIEPFGGAATCIGGAIRDPLSGRAYVYQAMRLTGAGDPLVPVKDTLPGKLPQRSLVLSAAAGYSSYGNQIGLATGMVDELYHPGYIAKRMEIGAVVGAAPAKNVRREVPAPGDVIILLGGRTGRDGCGGATGSSKAHKRESLETCGAEVQKGNAPVERKLQRLFRDARAARLIKRCNDFGAGGVSVAIGELADGLDIDLLAVPKKYDGLDGTELAISESQERMAVVLDPSDVETFLSLAHSENLEATPVAKVTASPRLVMRIGDRKTVDISREFLNSNGAKKRASVHVCKGTSYSAEAPKGKLAEKLRSTVSGLNACSRKGLSERFDSTIGAGSVLMPFGGKYQLTPAMAMAAKLPVDGETTTCSGMAWGFDPYISEKSCYKGAYLAVAESVSKLIAAGFSRSRTHLTLQEYFERLGSDPDRWGKPLSALLGALDAQLDLGVAAVGGKDSMSGTFEDIHVPPTLVSFAVADGSTDNVTSPEFKNAGSKVVLIAPTVGENGLPTTDSLISAMDTVESLIRDKHARSVSVASARGIAEAIFKMCLGNRIGFKLDPSFDASRLFAPANCSFIVELADDMDVGTAIGSTCGEYAFFADNETVPLEPIQEAFESKLEPVMPYRSAPGIDPSCIPSVAADAVEKAVPSPSVVSLRPHALIPVFPGTNCEYDTARALTRAGAKPEIFVINNLSAKDIAESCNALAAKIADSQIIVLPGGFSGGDEPDGSAKFITAFFRAPVVTEAVREFLKVRRGLMLGICNGFQALVKLGLVPFGDIRDMDDSCPTLTFNSIGRHQSMLVRTRVASTMSPWMSRMRCGDVYTVAISHGEGRFVGPDSLISSLCTNGQVAAQYVGLNSLPTMDTRYNPNGSMAAIEAATSPDGLVLGKMGHTERSGADLYKNVPGRKFQPLFEGGVYYYK